jgi:hypothetical protein
MEWIRERSYLGWPRAAAPTGLTTKATKTTKEQERAWRCIALGVLGGKTPGPVAG